MYGYNYIKSSNGYDISLKEMANNDAKKIVLAVHGLNGNKEANHIVNFTEKANKENIGVISMDLPGHGGSNISYITIENCLNDIDSVFNYIKSKYNIESISCLGNSFGSYLLLLDIIKRGNKYDEACLLCPALKMDLIIYNTILKYYNGNVNDWKMDMYNDDKILHVTYEIYKELMKNRLFELYNKDITKNIHLIHGDCDELAPLDDSIDFSKTFNTSLDIIEGANHTFDKGLENATDKVLQYIKKRY